MGIASSAVLVLLALMVSAPAARAQDERNASQLRTVHGIVMDKSENPIPSSVVYLRNMSTNAVRTYIPGPDGVYRFTGLDPNVDFQIQAEYKHLKSAKRTISSFDSRRDIEINLIIPLKN
ncbi:MAG TPA: carboxypeptidase-like regulatory domain-containing protein [Candidatus Acidoferrales bacterium]|nr:carboxypeptidase-like regulatory domain-containing protein [Candidatus Acidoferrales bacterium]